MGMVYVALNGDGVGEQIGNAILSDDHQTLSGLSRKFKDAHANIEKWAQRKGGEIVASSGDETIFSLPEEMVGELESIKDQYAQASGATLTIGIGQTISQASKALIYGKLNEKNQIVEYEPQMDDYISGDQKEGSEDEESDTEEGVGEEFGDSEEGEEYDEESDEDEIPSPDDIVNSASQQNRQHEGLDSEDEESEDESFGEEAEQLEDEEEEDTQPAHEQDMSVGEDMAHDSEENEDDEQDDDNIEADEEPEVFGGNTEPMDEDLDQDVDEDIENQTEDSLSEDEGFGEEDQEEEGGFGDEDIPELSPEEIAGQEGQDEDSYPTEEGQEVEGQEEGSDADEFLNEMMHSNMDGQEQEQDPETEELKQKIFTALQSIKGNREMLDQMQVQNPELYQGIMANIQSMIEMGKKLGMGGQSSEDQEMEGQEPQMEDQSMQPEMEEDPSAMGDELEQAPVKKPQGSFQA